MVTASRERFRCYESSRENHFSRFFECHITCKDFLVIHKDYESRHRIWRGRNEDGSCSPASLRINEVAGDEADKTAAWARVFDIGDPFEFLRPAKISNRINELLNGRIDESEERNTDNKIIDPAARFLAGPVCDSNPH